MGTAAQDDYFIYTFQRDAYCRYYLTWNSLTVKLTSLFLLPSSSQSSPISTVVMGTGLGASGTPKPGYLTDEIAQLLRACIDFLLLLREAEFYFPYENRIVPTEH